MPDFTIKWEEAHSITMEFPDEEAARTWWREMTPDPTFTRDEYYDLRVLTEDDEDDS